MLSTTKECALLRTCSVQLEATGKGTQSYLIHKLRTALSFESFVSQGAGIRVSQYEKAISHALNFFFDTYSLDVTVILPFKIY